jgi:hypothetical protein
MVLDGTVLGNCRRLSKLSWKQVPEGQYQMYGKVRPLRQAVLARSSLVDVRRDHAPSVRVRIQQGHQPTAADTKQFICADCLHVAAVQCTIHSALKFKCSKDSHFIHFKPKSYKNPTVCGKSEMKSACFLSHSSIHRGLGDVLWRRALALGRKDHA